MARRRRKQMASPPHPHDTLNIIRAELSKRGGGSHGARARWLIEQEKARLPETAKKPDKRNLPAVKRWVRDPTASNLAVALSPGLRPKPKKKRKPMPYPGKPV